MRAVRLLLAVALLLGRGTAVEVIPKEEYQERRAALRKSLPQGVAVLFGRTERDADESRIGFLQEPNFLYLTGWEEPGAILLLAGGAEPAGGLPGEVIFLPPHNPGAETYTGKRAAAQDAGAREATGFADVLAIEGFEAQLQKYLEHYRKVYTLAPLPEAVKLRALLPLREVEDVSAAVGRLRLKKSPREIAWIQRSIDVTEEAHRAAWKRLSPGLFEYQAAATLLGGFFDAGCRAAYPPIVGAGLDGTVLHYMRNSRRMDDGELLLIDAAAECGRYAADITRTVPVSGRFSARQKELYEVVLGAEKAVIDALKPGMNLERNAPNSITQIAFDYINSHGQDREGKPLGPYLLHAVGHHVGLEVHDAGKLLMNGPLEAGNVITVEPGVYIADEGVGIRIEDVVLITEQGAKLLSSSLPREAADVENALRR